MTALSIHAARSAARIDSGETHAVAKCIHHTGRDAAMRTTKFCIAKVALRAVVLACRHNARAPVVHEVTDHAVRGYCTVIIICSDNGSVVKSHLHACNIHTGHSPQTARQRKVYWPAVRVPKGQPNLATTGRPFLSHATTPQRRTASRAEIPCKA
jgi:hypothetical protein